MSNALDLTATPGRLDGVFLLTPTIHQDQRGFFCRTYDADSVASIGLSPSAFVQDSQSRSHRGVVRGMHCRAGVGETKLLRCARGSMYVVVVDTRLGSDTLGQWESFELDDVDMRVLVVPRGMSLGWQALAEPTDAVYRIDSRYDPSLDVSFRHDDPVLGIPWPLPVTGLSDRDRSATDYRSAQARLREMARLKG